MIQSLKGVQKNIAYLSIVEIKELDSLGKLYDQYLAQKFELFNEIERIKQLSAQKVLEVESEIEILTKELKRLDGLRNEVVQFDFKNKNKVKKYA